jgi:hypothetical protein
MPDVRLSLKEAPDIAAYLYTLEYIAVIRDPRFVLLLACIMGLQVAQGRNPLSILQARPPPPSTSLG